MKIKIAIILAILLHVMCQNSFSKSDSYQINLDAVKYHINPSSQDTYYLKEYLRDNIKRNESNSSVTVEVQHVGQDYNGIITATWLFNGKIGFPYFLKDAKYSYKNKLELDAVIKQIKNYENYLLNVNHEFYNDWKKVDKKISGINVIYQDKIFDNIANDLYLKYGKAYDFSNSPIAIIHINSIQINDKLTAYTISVTYKPNMKFSEINFITLGSFFDSVTIKPENISVINQAVDEAINFYEPMVVAHRN